MAGRRKRGGTRGVDGQARDGRVSKVKVRNVDSLLEVGAGSDEICVPTVAGADLGSRDGKGQGRDHAMALGAIAEVVKVIWSSQPSDVLSRALHLPTSVPALRLELPPRLRRP